MLSKNCNLLGTLKDSLVCDRIACGLLDKTVRDRLLREANLDLSLTIRIWKSGFKMLIAESFEFKKVSHTSQKMVFKALHVPLQGILPK